MTTPAPRIFRQKKSRAREILSKVSFWKVLGPLGIVSPIHIVFSVVSFFFQDWCQCMVLQARSTLFWAMVWLVRCLVWVSYPDPWKTLGLNPDGLRFEGGNIPDVLCKCVLLYSYCYIYIWICRHTQMYIYIYIRIYLYIYYLNEKIGREYLGPGSGQLRLQPANVGLGLWNLQAHGERVTWMDVRTLISTTNHFTWGLSWFVLGYNCITSKANQTNSMTRNFAGRYTRPIFIILAID